MNYEYGFGDICKDYMNYSVEVIADHDGDRKEALGYLMKHFEQGARATKAALAKTLAPPNARSRLSGLADSSAY
jgi:hypothetical protein